MMQVNASNKADRWIIWFLLSAGVILFLTGLAKIASSLGSARILGQMDPIFNISFRHLMQSVGLLEMVVGSLVLCVEKRNLNLSLVSWMAANFAFYRIGLWEMGWHRPCACLGNLTDSLHISSEKAESIMLVIFIYLLTGCLLSWFWIWLKIDRRPRNLTRAYGLSFVIICSFPCLGYSQEFQVKGTVVAECKFPSLYQNSYDFNLIVSNHTWQLTTKSSADTSGGDYCVLTSDGTNIYGFHDLEAAIANRSPDNAPPAGYFDNRGEAMVVQQDVPVWSLAEAAGPVWLAFVSGNYFKKQETNLVKVVWPRGFEAGDLTLFESVKRHASWKLNDSGILDQLTYLADIMDVRTCFGPPLSFDIVSRVINAGYSGYATNAQYSVLQSTNFQNLKLPVESILDIYGPDDGQLLRKDHPSLTMRYAYRYHILAKSFQKLDKGLEIPPSVPVLTLVNDCRFKASNGMGYNIPYAITNRFLTMAEVKTPAVSQDYHTFPIRILPVWPPKKTCKMYGGLLLEPWLCQHLSFCQSYLGICSIQKDFNFYLNLL